MKKKGIYDFISLFLLILTSSILYINHFSYADNLANTQKEKLLLKNLRTAAQFEYDEKFRMINDW